MLLVDAHVHIYDCFDLKTFFDSAFENFRSQAAKLGQEDDFTGVLLLAETSKDSWFQRLRAHANDFEAKTKRTDPWTFHLAEEDCSLWAQGSNSRRLLVIAGRQIVTSENLEVLALMTEKGFEDGDPLKEVIQAVKESGAIPVIPWGFGKWTGKRGRILKEMLEEEEGPQFFLGDNGGRARFLPKARHLKLAESKAIPLLRGSDPLPFAPECGRVGSFGFSASGSISLEQPGKDLKGILLDSNAFLRPYGSPENPVGFFRNQLRMNFLKRQRSDNFENRIMRI